MAAMLQDVPILEDLLALDLSGIIGRARQPECSGYAVELQLRLLAAGGTPPAGDPLRAAHLLVAFVLALRLDPDDDSKPLKASCGSPNWVPTTSIRGTCRASWIGSPTSTNRRSLHVSPISCGSLGNLAITETAELR